MLARRGALLGGRAPAQRPRRARLSVVAFTQPPPPPRQPRNDAAAVPAAWGSSSSPSGQNLPLPPSLAPLGAAFDAALDRYWRASPTARAVVDAMWRRRYGGGGGGGGSGSGSAPAPPPPTLAPLHHDHLAFRTFGVPGHGVAALGAALRSWGYVPHDEGGRLVFPKKKLRAAWFAPPPGLEGALPRVFVSELVVSELSPAAAAVVRRYAGPPPPPAPAPSPLEVASAAAPGAGLAGEHDPHAPPSSSSSSPSTSLPSSRPSSPHSHSSSSSDPSSPAYLASAAARAWTSVVAGGLPWTERPTLEDWRLLAEESEYAAWVLAHGYSVNHTALSLHRLERRELMRERQGLAAPPPSDDPRGLRSSLADFADELKAEGFSLNDDGGSVVKASPGDGGLLLQCSTVADVVPDYEFAGGLRAEDAIPGAYLEFVERRPLPRFAQLPRRDLREWHRRDGFEMANADSIFASTTLAAVGVGGGGGGIGVGGGGGGDAMGAAGALGGGGGASGTGGGPEAPAGARALPKSASSGASGSGA